jgi:prenylcysteine alpha-carboxyl methylesterase
MEGEESLQKFSPQVMIKAPSARSAVPLLPHIILFHGTSDNSIPSAERCVKLQYLNKGPHGKPTI